MTSLQVNALNVVTYAYPRAKYMGSFLKIKSAIMAQCIAQDEVAQYVVDAGKAGVQELVNKMEKSWLGTRYVVSGLKSGNMGLSISAQSILAASVFYWRGASLCMRLPQSNSLVDIYTHAPRGYSMELLGVQAGASSDIVVQNLTNSYGREGYGVALRYSSYCNAGLCWLALETADSGEGVKGAIILRVTEYNDYGLIVDNAAKYLDVTSLLQNVE